MNGVFFARLAALAATLFLPSALVSAATFTVTVATDPDCSDGACDFQSALTAAAGNSEDDVLNLPDTTGLPGGSIVTTTTFTYTASGDFDLDINGSDTGRTSLHGNATKRVLSIELTSGSFMDPAQISISRVTFRNGNSGGADGGGLAVSTYHAHVTVKDCSFLDNDAGDGAGGGAWINAPAFGSGTTIIRNNTFQGNRAVEGAGLSLSCPGATVEDNRFSYNRLTDAGRGGGASVVGNSGLLLIRQNLFWRNDTADGVEDCQGGGLYLNSGSIDQVSVEGNTFKENQFGHNGSGAGAYLWRVDGPLSVESNIFVENMIDGTAEDTGGGGLWLSLFGSFAEGAVVNNIFTGNAARLGGTAAWITSLDGGVLFANNTAIFNHPRIPPASEAGSSAVLVESPQVDFYNNIIWRNVWTGNDLLVHDGLGTETVTLRNNDIGRYALPTVVILDEGDNISADPGFTSAYHSTYLESDASRAVDAGMTYAGMPATDVHGEARAVDGDGNGTPEVDIGADEFGAIPTLSPPRYQFLSSGSGLLFPVVAVAQYFTLWNLSTESLVVTDIRLAVDSPDWTFELSHWMVGTTLAPGNMVTTTVIFHPDTRENSTNLLIVETSAGTVSSELIGTFVPAVDGDGDGVSDLEENIIGDGNCDGIADSIQDNVASIIPGDTIVAPTEAIGALGHAYPAGTIPFLRNVDTRPSPDEGGGPLVRDFPYRFLSFDVTTNTALAAGGYFPISIIVAIPDPIDGYVKRGPVPADFPPSLVRPDGTYDFIQEPASPYPWLELVGAVVENDVMICEVARTVVHLRFIDGMLGDGDLIADGWIRDPGGPAIMPVDNGRIGDTVWCDSDLDGIYDAGEGVDSVTVSLHDDTNCDGAPDAVRTTTSTSNDGGYLFTNVPRGTVADPTCYVVEPDIAGLGACDNPIASTTHATSLTDTSWTDVDGDFGFVEDLDYGDLPSAYGLTMRADDGARHGAGPPLMLGTCVDFEADGLPDPLTLGDDTRDTGCIDDEGSVVPLGNWTDGTGEFEIAGGVSGDGCLNVWLDYTDGAIIGPDNDFEDSYSGISEWVVQNLVVDASTTIVSFPLPVGIPVVDHDFFMRTRLTPRDGAGGCAGAEAYVGTSVAAAMGAAMGGMIVDTRVEGASVPVGLLRFTVE